MQLSQFSKFPKHNKSLREFFHKSVTRALQLANTSRTRLCDLHVQESTTTTCKILSFHMDLPLNLEKYDRTAGYCNFFGNKKRGSFFPMYEKISKKSECLSF